MHYNLCLILGRHNLYFYGFSHLFWFLAPDSDSKTAGDIVNAHLLGSIFSLPTMAATNEKQVIHGVSHNDSSFTSLNDSNKSFAARLIKALRFNSTLTTLELGYNKFGHSKVRRLAEALSVNCTLTALDLRSDQVGAEGAKLLTKALLTLARIW